MRYIISSLLTSSVLGTVALAEVPQVVTDIPPVHSITAAVMGDLGQPVLLLEKGASEHHFQLRPSQAGEIAGADLVVMVSPDLTPWLEGALAARAEGPVLTLLTTPGTETEEYEHDGHDHDHDHGDHDDHADHDDHDGHGHSHEGTDPHAWLDPHNGIFWAQAIAAELSRLDPDNAGTYADNAAALTRKIAAVDAANKALLAPLEDRSFLTQHDAYGYFADHYDLEYEDSFAGGDAATPGAKHQAELREDLVAGEFLCLFPEVQHDPKALTQLAEGAAVKVGGALDPAGSMMEPGPDLYPALLAGMAQTIADCLKG